eukprot:Ihof_evm3s528 gene=Ihof_evmTU3s528
MSKSFNAFGGVVGRIYNLPFPIAINNRLLGLVLGWKVKLFGTAKIDVQEISHHKVSLFIRNRTRVQNHIGGVHAAAMALVAESATGFVVGMNVPIESVPVIKSMTINYIRRSKGSLKAVAQLNDDQIKNIRETAK